MSWQSHYNKNDRVKLVLWDQISLLIKMMLSCKHASNMPTFTYNPVSSDIKKNAIILSIIQNIFKLRDTKLSYAYLFCILLLLKRPRYNWNIVESGVKPHNPNTLLKKADGLNHHLNIRFGPYNYMLSYIFRTYFPLMWENCPLFMVS